MKQSFIVLLRHDFQGVKLTILTNYPDQMQGGHVGADSIILLLIIAMSTTGYITRGGINEGLLLIAVFAIPLNNIVAPIAFVAWAISGLFTGMFGKPDRAHLWPFVLFIAYYLYHVVGLLWTEDLVNGTFDLEVKASLLLFPFLFFFHRSIGKPRVHRIILAFTGGILIASVLSFMKGYGCYTEDGNLSCFYGTYMAYLHPTYLSVYIAFVSGYLTYTMSDSFAVRKWGRFGLTSGLLVYFMFFASLLASRSGLMLIGVAVLIGAVLYLIRTRHAVSSIGVLAGLLGFLYLFVSISPMASTKLEEMVEAVEMQEDILQGDSTVNKVQGSAMRLQVWQVSLEIIADEPFTGVGTGDVTDQIVKRCNEHGYLAVSDKGLNAHNQFLQSGVALGVPGLLLLVLIYLFMLVFAIRRRQFVLILFTVVCGAVSLTESILETQAGVLFFAFFAALFMFTCQANDEDPILPTKN